MHELHVAPMHEVTDRHFRMLIRCICPSYPVVLWSEMTWPSQITRESATEVEHAIGYSVEEHPVVLQLGGGDPAALARAAAAGAAMGYDEINLNCGCPAGSRGEAQEHYGARLMAEPERVGECCCAMHHALNQASCDAPVTVKCRLGVDGRESYEELHEFVAHVSTVAGVKHFIVHARHAMLGLNAAKNRSIPPLRHDWVLRLVEDFPSLRFTINGGITTLEQAVEWLRRGVHGVMIGRQAAAEPYLFARAGLVLGGEPGRSRREALEAYLTYAERAQQERLGGGHPGTLARALLAPLGGLFFGTHKAAKWRAALTEVTRGTAGGAVPSFGALGVLVHGCIKACCIPEELLDTRPALSIPKSPPLQPETREPAKGVGVRVSRLPAALLRARPGASSASRPGVRELLHKAAAPFGCTSAVVVLHAARVALLQMVSEEAAAAMCRHCESSPLELGGRVVTVEQTDEPISHHRHGPPSDDTLRSECMRCLDSIVVCLEAEEVKANADRRKQRHAEHLATMNSVFATQRFASKGICWAHHQRMRGCEWANCGLSHESTPPPRFCCAPPRMRSFAEVETYPAEYREASIEKCAVNKRLVELAEAACGTAALPVRCLVLDGPGGRTAKALRASVGLGVQPCRLHMPNVCTATYRALKSSGLGAPFLGSLRAFLDSRDCPSAGHAQEPAPQEGSDAAQPTGSRELAATCTFGVVYADYCCSLYAGRLQVELSPTHDLITLFRRGHFDDHAILAVTLARPDDEKARFVSEVHEAVHRAIAASSRREPGAASMQCETAGRMSTLGDAEDACDARVLDAVVTALSDAFGYSAALCESFDFESTFVRMWRVERRLVPSR